MSTPAAGRATTARKVYLASPLGFSATSALWNTQVLLPAVRAAGLHPLDPWEQANADSSGLTQALTQPLGADSAAALHQANERLAAANLTAIEQCDALLAVLDGTDVDSGTAAEIGYASALSKPIVGLRTDLRLAGDNHGAIVNLQVEHCIRRTGGTISSDLPAALQHLLALLR